MKTRGTMWVAAALVVAIGTGAAWAAEIKTLSAVADTYVQKQSPDDNFGTSGATRVRGSSYDPMKTYIRFDMSSVSDPTQITAATFSVSSYLGGNWNAWTFNVYGLNNGDAGENWGETAITWNDAPANDSSSAGFASNATLLGTFTGTGNSYVNFSSAGLVNFLKADTDGKVTLMISTTNTTGTIQSINARNQSSPPKLEVTVVPEPATVCLLGLGGLGALLRKRRAVR